MKVFASAELAKVRGWCPVGEGQYSTPPGPHHENRPSAHQNRSQIGAFSPEFVPYASIETCDASPSILFGRALLWNIQQPGSSESEPCDGRRHRQGCLPLVLALSCPAVGRLVLSACSSILQAVQQQRVTGKPPAMSATTIKGVLEASLQPDPSLHNGAWASSYTTGVLGTFLEAQQQGFVYALIRSYSKSQ